MQEPLAIADRTTSDAYVMTPGGSHRYEDRAPLWWTLADPEGIEVDVASWPGVRSRDRRTTRDRRLILNPYPSLDAHVEWLTLGGYRPRSRDPARGRYFGCSCFRRAGSRAGSQLQASHVSSWNRAYPARRMLTAKT